MPLYDLRCRATDKIFERFIPLKDFEAPLFCDCGSPAIRVISTPLFSVDKTDYTCPVTGRWIGSKRQHEENLRLTDCRVLESGEKEVAARRRQEAEVAIEKRVDATVEKTIEAMPSEKREKLYNEMVSSDIAIERR